MSHEGIRIVSREESQRAQAEEQPLPKEATTPKKVRVDATGGSGVQIEWADGHTSSWTFPWLREACPCAICHEAREADGRKPGEPKPKPATLLPMFEPPPRPLETTPVGHYAVKFKWSDGHESGIYSWEYLRRIG
jgi:DUF971 family protein